MGTPTGTLEVGSLGGLVDVRKVVGWCVHSWENEREYFACLLGIALALPRLQAKGRRRWDIIHELQ